MDNAKWSQQVKKGDRFRASCWIQPLLKPYHTFSVPEMGANKSRVCAGCCFFSLAWNSAIYNGKSSDQYLKSFLNFVCPYAPCSASPHPQGISNSSSSERRGSSTLVLVCLRCSPDCIISHSAHPPPTKPEPLQRWHSHSGTCKW